MDHRRKLDVSPGEYDELIQTLSGQVSAALKAAALEQSEVHEPISESLKQLLLELCDSASMLGANRFVQLYPAYKGNGGVTQAHCRLLIQSRQQLEGRSRLKCHLSCIWREDKQRPTELFQI